MIRKASLADTAALAMLSLQLWPDNTEKEMVQEFSALLCNPACAIFLAEAEGRAVGFAQCQLRHDYVEGTECSPVGYLEGIYVCASHRGRGFARQLLSACEGWAKEMGCREFASDCELHNLDSLAFHLKTGFAEANRIICFVKPL